MTKPKNQPPIHHPESSDHNWQSCSKKTSKRDSVVGKSPEVWAAIGKGVNLNTRKLKNFMAFDKTKIEPYIDETKIAITQADFSWKADRSEMRDALSCDTSASVSYGVVEVNGGCTYNTENLNTGLTKTMVGISTIKTVQRTFDPQSSECVAPTVKKILKNSDFDKFYEKYGNGYIQSTIMGARVIAMVSMTFKSTAAMSKIGASLDVGVAGGALGVDVKAAIEKESSLKNETVTIHFKFEQQGGDVYTAVGDLINDLIKQGANQTAESNEATVTSSLVEAVDWFNRIQMAVMNACGRLGKGLQKNPDSAVALKWTTAPYEIEIFDDLKNTRLSPDVINQINHYQKKLNGMMNTMLGLYSLSDMPYQGSHINLIPGMKHLGKLKSRRAIAEVQGVLYGAILNCLSAQTDLNALDRLDDLKVMVKEGSGDTGNRLKIGDSPLMTALDYIEFIRSHCWLYVRGPSDTGAMKGFALGLITDQGGGKGARLLPPGGEPWQNYSIKDAREMMTDEKGTWIGHGTHNLYSRFGAPWSFGEKGHTATPLYPGYTNALVPTNNGLMSDTLRLNMKAPEGEYSPGDAVVASTGAILEMTQNGLQCKNNDGTLWPSDWPTMAHSKYMISRGPVYFDLFTHKGGEPVFQEWRYNVDDQATYDPIPPGSIAPDSQKGIRLIGTNVWCNAFTLRITVNCFGIEGLITGSRITVLKNMRLFNNPAPPAREDLHRFFRISNLWDAEGRLLMNT